MRRALLALALLLALPVCAHAARVWSSGWECNNESTSEGGASPDQNGSISSTTYHSGAYSLRISSLASTRAKGLYFQYLASEGTSSAYFRAYLYIATLPSAANTIFSWNDSSSSSSTPSAYMTLDNSGVLGLYDEDGQITGTATLDTGTWYRLEAHIDTTAAGGSQTVEARVDGAAAFASAATRNISASNQPYYFHFGGNLAGESETTGDWYFDDVAVNTNTGSFQNSWPGDGAIIHLRPSGAGDASDWTNDYTAVDEVKPNDATDFVSSNTLNQIDDHDIDNTPAAIAADATISVVSVSVRYNGAGASSNASFVVRSKEASAGTTEESGTITPSNATWTTNSGSAPKSPPLTFYDLPGASTTAWTKATLDTAQIGYRLSASSTNAAQVTAVWMLVEYTTGGAPAAPTWCPALMQQEVIQ